MSTVYDCADPAERTAGIQAATSALKGGSLVVLPTDTLYGIGADAFDADAVAALLTAKRRGRNMPVPVLVGSWRTVDGLVQTVTTRTRDLVEAFWPGGLSLVLPQAPSLLWDLGDTGGSVLVRMPLHPVAIELLREVGPMAVSSANVSGQQPAQTIDEARNQLGENVSVYLDGGSIDDLTPSTIVDMTGRTPRVLREGAVSIEAIADVVGCTVAELRGTESE